MKRNHRASQRAYSLPSTSEAKAKKHWALTMFMEALLSSEDRRTKHFSWELPSGHVSPIYRRGGGEWDEKLLTVAQPLRGSAWTQDPILALFLSLSPPRTCCRRWAQGTREEQLLALAWGDFQRGSTVIRGGHWERMGNGRRLGMWAGRGGLGAQCMVG